MRSTGCPSDDTGDSDDEIGDTETDEDTTDDGTEDTTDDTTEDTTDETTDETDETDTTDETTGNEGFAFSDADFGDYNRVDRAGMPAVNTALITSKDEYNAANPTDDADAMFVDEIVANIDGLHLALDADLIANNLVPCPLMECVEVGAPLILPDHAEDRHGIRTPRSPNGRALEDPVMDITLAVLLLDLLGGSHGVGDLIGLNPTANDVPFQADFPYLAPPN